MSDQLSGREPEQEHGIAGAFYASDGERYLPVMECTCGFGTGRQFNWEETGAAFDEHLKAVESNQT